MRSSSESFLSAANPAHRPELSLLANKAFFSGINAAFILFADVEQHKFLMLRRSETSFFPTSWGLPGGLFVRGENAEEAAGRELKEELDHKAQRLMLWAKFMFSAHDDGWPVNYFIFLSAMVQQHFEGMNHEHDQQEWLSADEIIAAMSSPITPHRDNPCDAQQSQIVLHPGFKHFFERELINIEHALPGLSNL